MVVWPEAGGRRMNHAPQPTAQASTEWSRLRRQRALRFVWWLLPVFVVLCAALWWLKPPLWAWFALFAWLLVAVASVWRHVQSLTLPRLIHHLNERHPAFQDSADLWAHQGEDDDNPLRQQQRLRVQKMFQPNMLDGLEATWPWLPVFWPLALAAMMLLAVAAWASSVTSWFTAGSDATEQSASQAVWSWDGWAFAVTPPSYTKQPSSTQRMPDLKAWQGSGVRVTSPKGQSWASVQMRQVASKQQVLLSNMNGTWQVSHTLDSSSLWRIHAQDADGRTLVSPQFVWQARVDQPPSIEVEAPRTQFTEVIESPSAWRFALSVRDDLGVTKVVARVAFSEGSGEHIQYTTTEHALMPEQAQSNRYVFELPFTQPLPQSQEVVVRFVATDGRAPAPQTTESSVYVLRWAPEPVAASADMEGVLRVAEPAMFRSQRQVIIDTETLLADWDDIDQGTRQKRASQIGMDQRLLRHRYGQHLGMEADEGGPMMPVSEDEMAHAMEDDHAGHGHEGHEHDDHDGHPHHSHEDEHEHEHDHQSDDEHDAHEAVGSVSADAHAHDPHAGHDHGGDLPINATMQDMMETFGHTHDYAEAATLFDPETRALLKQAVGAMWQSELALRQAKPAESLPHQHEALLALKKVQQAERIYLARTGLDLPQIDFERRLKKEPESLMNSPIEQPLPPPKPSPLNAQATELSTHLATDVPFTRSTEAWSQLLQDTTQAMDEAGTDEVVRLRVLGALDDLRHQPDSHAAKTQALQAIWGVLPAAKHTPQRRVEATNTTEATP